MFGRYSDRARRSLVLAQEEAHRKSHSDIGTEHLLAALVLDDQLALCQLIDAPATSLAGALEAELIGRPCVRPRHVSAAIGPHREDAMRLAEEQRQRLRNADVDVDVELLLLGILPEEN